MKKIGVLTSGGDAPGMNAAVRAAVRSSENSLPKCGITSFSEYIPLLFINSTISIISTLSVDITVVSLKKYFIVYQSGYQQKTDIFFTKRELRKGSGTLLICESRNCKTHNEAILW